MDGPSNPQDSPKMALGPPRRPQNDPQIPQNGPEPHCMDPQTPRIAPKWPSDPQTRPKMGLRPTEFVEPRKLEPWIYIFLAILRLKPENIGKVNSYQTGNKPYWIWGVFSTSAQSRKCKNLTGCGGSTSLYHLFLRVHRQKLLLMRANQL